MAGPGPSSSRLSLADLLPQLPTAAADALIAGLGNYIGTVRSTCSFLRNFIDQNVTCLNLRVGAGMLKRWEDGKALSLERWPRLSKMELCLANWGQEASSDDDSDDELPAADLGHLLTLPFLGLSAAARQRITCLVVEQEVADDGGDGQLEGGLPHLALLLPSLRELRLPPYMHSGATAVLQRRLMDSLAAFTHLQHVELGICSSLPHAGRALAGSSLRRLHLSTDGDVFKTVLPQLLQVTQLQHIHLRRTATGDPDREILEVGAAGAGTLSEALKGMSPVLKSLTLLWSRRDIQLALSFRQGLMTAARMLGGLSGSLQYFASLAASLQACSALLGPEFEKLTLGDVFLPPEEPTDRSARAPLWDLARRARVFTVKDVSSYTPAIVAGALRLLGKPQSVALKCPASFYGATVTLQLRAAGGKWPAGALKAPTQADTGAAVDAPLRRDGGSAAQQQEQEQQRSGPPSPPTPANEQPPLRLPSAVAMCRGALQRLAGGPLPALGAPAPGTAAAGPGEQVAGSGGDEDGAAAAAAAAVGATYPLIPAELAAAALQEDLNMLLLCGPGLGVLVQCSEALKAWMRKVDAAARLARMADGNPVYTPNLVFDYLALPFAPECCCLLVSCEEVAAVAAVAAAASEHGACGSLMSVVPMRGKLAVTGYSTERVWSSALQEELQAQWDARVGLCGGDPEAELELMRRLLELVSEIKARTPHCVHQL
ncbi:hypothetical protein GPECTOR_1g45 [Gonium pectorale]|uniref:Uncharacterized protein n=1 Tax=Gonium pectorale TaxID=33097 RepID=A0A150H3C7_GONPE|nr:hypothetical protein GPECTOR_1g45 [Gonium pectorale]|eukprot:KXZ56502.1 hypothetical protein GPECTOR_1g45 [Gonium pectorale]